MSAPCGQCDNGKLRYHHVHRDDDGNETGQTWGSNLCECRRDLPPRHGSASWWTTKVIHHEVWTGVVGVAEIEVTEEVPVSPDNYPLLRRGENVYWPCSVKVDADGLLFIGHEEAASFAAAVQRAAGVASVADALAYTPDRPGDDAATVSPSSNPKGAWSPLPGTEEEGRA